MFANIFTEFVPISAQLFLFGDNFDIFSQRVVTAIIVVSLIIAFLDLKKYRFNLKNIYFMYRISSLGLIDTLMIFTVQHLINADYFYNNNNYSESNIINAIAFLMAFYLLWINILAFFAYSFDKIASFFGIVVLRIPEKILHLYAIFGGTFGAIIAMEYMIPI
ncbi:MAG: DUF1294 domain-containing protein [Okeania sp. SIO3B5]|uniref:DUF1294 domain-containing protein n=1 Tax=Okeania sp. SIO3B5 TaxID=2607811 RepID=UPI0013FF0DFE|nr:DUF1294 domain-containing protein [Okeania sp. SIO3B5]NEO53757.1 DUF1294 domain-containing protein [Okeania sp. SIO3B5]